jgi:uncharacterized hydrophobic protein (TIGR00341 family)
VPLRLLELTVPDADTAQVPDLLQDIPILHLWTAESGKPVGLVRILLDAQHVEALSDALVGHFGARDGFRLIVLPVEATVPPPEPPAAGAVAQQGEVQSGQGEPQRISREELYEDLAEASGLTPVYVVMVALSTVVAAVGLIRGDIAVVIGAMVIAPLLGPNVALSLACTLGDLQLAKRSLKAIGAGVAIAAALSCLLGAILHVDPHAPDIAARTTANLSDFILALAAGAAGSLAFTSGVPAVVVGVMVAVALLPPLVVAGLLAGAGHAEPAAGALILLLTNLTCVNLAAVATFLLQKIRPRTWWEAERARRATQLAVTIWIILLALLLGLMLLSHAGTAHGR